MGEQNYRRDGSFLFSNYLTTTPKAYAHTHQSITVTFAHRLNTGEPLVR